MFGSFESVWYHSGGRARDKVFGHAVRLSKRTLKSLLDRILITMVEVDLERTGYPPMRMPRQLDSSAEESFETRKRAHEHRPHLFRREDRARTDYPSRR